MKFELSMNSTYPYVEKRNVMTNIIIIFRKKEELGYV